MAAFDVAASGIMPAKLWIRDGSSWAVACGGEQWHEDVADRGG